MFRSKIRISLLNRIQARVSYFKETTVQKYEAIEKRVEGTMAENWLRFWKHLLRDYVDVAVDVAKETREKPLKAVFLSSTAGILTYFTIHNPTAVHFQDSFLRAMNDASVVHHSLVREESLKHLKYIQQCYNSNLIRHTSFGLFSIIWVDTRSNICKSYETQCSYLQLGYSDIYEQIIDFGFLDSWWNLAKKMADYDVNF